MKQIEKLKARLATASQAEAQTIRELIATLEAAPEEASPPGEQLAAAPAGQKGNPFCNPNAKWYPADEATRLWNEGLVRK